MSYTTQVGHTGVYRRGVYLTAGTIYRFETANLNNVWWFQSAAADPVMYLVNSNQDIVAFNDDAIGLASQILYTPTQTGNYTLIIRAYSTKTPGTCDLYQAIGETRPVLIERGVYFNGTRVDAAWNVGDVLTTMNSSGDPYLFAIIGNKMYWNDDGAGYPNSRIDFPIGGQGTVIAGSYSRAREGTCTLSLSSAAGPQYLHPYLSPTPRVPVEKQVVLTPEMKEFAQELIKTKPALEEMQPSERDNAVWELQQKFLGDAARYERLTQVYEASVDFVRGQQNFLRQYEEIEGSLKEMSYEERCKTLTILKEQLVGPAHNVDKPDNLLKDENIRKDS